MASSHGAGRRRLGPARLLTFLLAGFAAGSVLGYLFMATADAVLQVKAERHYVDQSSAGASKQPREPAQRGGQAAGGVQASGGALSLADAAQLPTSGDTVHTLCTSNGSPYLNFQTRIMYGTYKLAQQMEGGAKLVAFTRILHRTAPDILMNGVPTWRAEPLTPACDNWCEFPVSDRPNAVRQFLDAAQRDASLVKAPWLLMIETDYVWMRPLAAPRAESSVHAQAFPFGYIQCQAPALEAVMRRMYPPERGPLSSLPNTGPAPALLRVQEWIKLTPDWERLAAHIEADAESKEKLGWVREMYAFSVAAALAGVGLDMRLPPACPLIAQPPADRGLGAAAMFHYTWGTVFNDEQGNKVWEFDKRAYTDASIQTRTPRIPEPPAWREGLRLQDGAPVDRALWQELADMIRQMNRAVDLLPDLTSAGAL